nr:ubiquitin fusion degradation protein 1 like [Quercus suber]
MDGPLQHELVWSSLYNLSRIRNEDLVGDKILLPPSALEQLLSASANFATESVRESLPTYDPFNSATFSAYQRAESQYQDQKQQLPYPLTFRLVNRVNGRVVFAGVREFSADDGEIVLSPFLRETLGLDVEDGEEVSRMEADKEYPTIMVHVTKLEKGTFVRLRPLEAGYDPEDWKALLEQHLRHNYTTLTNREVLVVPGGRGTGGSREMFRFLLDGFKPNADGVCIVDTDLEVDIEALNEEQARETLQKIAEKLTRAPGSDRGSSGGGEIDIFNAQQGQVLPGEYVDYQLSSWSKSSTIEFELSPIDGDSDLDLLVSPLSAAQRARPRIDEYVWADFEGRPTKRLRLAPTNIELESAEVLFVTVHAFPSSNTQPNGQMNALSTSREPLRFTLRARHLTSDDEVEDTIQAPDQIPRVDDVQCKNCNQWVPKRTLMLHENFCLRNNILCPKGCGQVFQKRSAAFESHWHCAFDASYGDTGASRSKHESLYHPAEVLRCTECSTSETFASIPFLARHKTTTCPAKQILCRFCHLVVPQEGDPDAPNAEAVVSGLTPHELADGSRTTECHLCTKIVRLRDMGTHLKNHDLDRVSRPPPILCRNVNCGRTLDTCSKTGDTRAGTRMGQGPGNDVGLCSVCFGPLYVSMHDPENKALKRRIERRYLQQLLTGCGKSWCRNEYCRNGRQSLGQEASVTTKDALPMIRPFLETLGKGARDTALHFCVDESSQKRKTLAEMLAVQQDGVPGQTTSYGLEWCVGALEAEKGDLDAARTWLKNWAPTRAEQEKM